jgi:catechol 2,3-dioxygenase
MNPVHSTYHNSDVAHIEALELAVRSLDRSVRFYQDVLGLRLHQRTPQRATLGSAHHAFLRLAEDPNTRPAQSGAGLYHFALLLPEEMALAQVFRHLIQRDVRLSGASDHVISHALYLNDPDGHGIELAVDTDPKSWPWRDGQLDVFSQNGPLNLHQLYALSSAEAFTTIHPDTRLGHVHLHAEDLEKSRSFYTLLLGMDVVIDLPGSALFLSHARYHHHLALNQWRRTHVQNHASPMALKQLDYRVPKASYLNLWARLKNDSNRVIRQNDELLLRDPNGFVLSVLES